MRPDLLRQEPRRYRKIFVMRFRQPLAVRLRLRERRRHLRDRILRRQAGERNRIGSGSQWKILPSAECKMRSSNPDDFSFALCTWRSALAIKPRLSLDNLGL